METKNDKIENVELRSITLEDTSNILKWRNNPSVKKNFCIQEDLTKETHLNWFHNKILTKEVVQFIIIEKPSNTPVGSTYLRDIDRHAKKAEFGIFIGEETARGKGIGTSATKLIIDYGFKKLGLHKIYLRVFSNNIQAIKAYEKAGFEYEGTAKDDILLPDGTYQDITFMSIINKE
ncbi:MAG: UDP-4-amino-4,6-dideoxy-N-acetyl-beta-L-altrosamine N-acetyltransferase [Clostridia bacterium]|nr:UDP-4-amino-4,6-dideoxy-N-acetyl-beta-L-altrosamine N-acetyltransferase [Clostridia bacterium]